MSYRFKKARGTARQARKLASRQLMGLREDLQAARSSPKNIVSGIYPARKRLKKIRALLHWCFEATGQKDFHRIERELHKTAQLLGPLRDGEVLQATFLSLVTELYGKQMPPSWVTAFQEHLQSEEKRNTGQFLQDFSRVMDSVEKNLNLQKKICWKEVSAQSLSTGLKTIYRSGRKCREIVLVDPTHRGFHEWRKQVKALWYVVRLMRTCWPKTLEPFAAELQALSQWLGEDHDLVVLETVLRRQVEPSKSKAMLELINLRRQALREKSLGLGEKVFAEKPGAFAQRMHRYWVAWGGAGELRAES